MLCRTPLEGRAELGVEKLAGRARHLGGPDLQACVPTPPGSYRASSRPPLPDFVALVVSVLSFGSLPSLRTHCLSSPEVTLILFHVSRTSLHRTGAAFLATASLETWPFPPEASSNVRRCSPCPRYTKHSGGTSSSLGLRTAHSGSDLEGSSPRWAGRRQGGSPATFARRSPHPFLCLLPR